MIMCDIPSCFESVIIYFAFCESFLALVFSQARASYKSPKNHTQNYIKPHKIQSMICFFYTILPQQFTQPKRLLTGSMAAFPNGRRTAVTGKWSWHGKLGKNLAKFHRSMAIERGKSLNSISTKSWIVRYFFNTHFWQKKHLFKGFWLDIHEVPHFCDSK